MASEADWLCWARLSSPIWWVLILRCRFSTSLMPSLDRTAEAHPYLVERVKAGKTGMKAEGFRRWTPEQAQAVRDRLNRALIASARTNSRESR